MANDVQESALETTPATETNIRQGLTIGANIDTQVLTAKAYPRDIKRCMQEIVDILCIDEEIAAACYYTLPRDGKTLTGPSIRLAEICASVFGNIQAGTVFVSNDGKFIIVKGWCRDLEKNYTVETAVTKSIINKYNKPYSESMQATTMAAASAIALRNAIFKIIPQVFIDKAYKKAMDIAVGGKDKAKFESKRQKVFEGLENLKIPTDKVLKYYNKTSINDITPDELKEIIGIGTSIKDTFLPIDEAFVRPSNYRPTVHAADHAPTPSTIKDIDTNYDPKTGELRTEDEEDLR